MMSPKPIYEIKYEDLRTSIYRTNEELGIAAAEEATDILECAIRKKGEANAIIATGNSQLTFLNAMRAMPVDWSKINIFHMDEYVGLVLHIPPVFRYF